MENRWEEDMEKYPERMKFETEENKKAGYARIVDELTVLAKTLEDGYNLHGAVCLSKILTDTLLAMSPEIYEHYRKVEDLLRNVVKIIVKKEKLNVSQFGAAALIGEEKILNRDDLDLFGQVLLEATQNNFLLPEKYEALGRALEMRSL